jgi:DNA-binding NarL/FixJ family response regulator
MSTQTQCQIAIMVRAGFSIKEIAAETGEMEMDVANYIVADKLYRRKK